MPWYHCSPLTLLGDSDLIEVWFLRDSEQPKQSVTFRTLPFDTLHQQKKLKNTKSPPRYFCNFTRPKMYFTGSDFPEGFFLPVFLRECDPSLEYPMP